jgi:uncharacterized protein HemX
MQTEQPTLSTAQPQETSQQAEASGSSSAAAPMVETPMVAQNGKSGGKKLLGFFLVLTVLSVIAVGFGVVMGRKAQVAQKTQQELERVVTATQEEEMDALTNQYDAVSTSDEIEEIETDLTDTTFLGIDNELTLIDKELTSVD